jgi:protoporphyrinogen IX oxidase
MTMLLNYYSELKTLHLLFVISWMAGIFYFPRILVHYAQGISAGEDVRRLLIMGNKLKGFMSVMFGLTMAFGVILMLALKSYEQGWFHIKLTLVFTLLGYQHYCFWHFKKIQQGKVKSHIFYRWLNEAPLFALIPILYLVIAKPF